ncbi:MAG: hypothetical protein R6U62_01130 [Bacteroidales bacterium]
MKPVKNLIVFLLLWIPALVYAQRPTNIPYDSEPVHFFESTENIIFYIIIPVIIILLYFVWRHRRRQQEENNKNKNQ